MDKKQKRKLALISLLLLLFSGCGYKFLNKGSEKVYIKKIENLTLQPKLQMYLYNNLTEVIINYPSFTLTSSEDNADYVLTILLNKINRTPLFYDKEDSDEIVSSKLTVEGEILLERNGEEIKKSFVQFISYPLSKSYDEEEVLNDITKKIAIKVWTIILENEERK